MVEAAPGAEQRADAARRAEEDRRTCCSGISLTEGPRLTGAVALLAAAAVPKVDQVS